MLRDVGAYKKYEVTHITGWKVLWFKGEFRTRLRIEQDRHRGCVSFKLLDSDVMSAFDGRWEVKPCTQRSLDKLYGKPANFNPFAGIAGAPPRALDPPCACPPLALSRCPARTGRLQRMC